MIPILILQWFGLWLWDIKIKILNHRYKLSRLLANIHNNTNWLVFAKYPKSSSYILPHIWRHCGAWTISYLIDFTDRHFKNDWLLLCGFVINLSRQVASPGFLFLIKFRTHPQVWTDSWRHIMKIWCGSQNINWTLLFWKIWFRSF